VKFEFRLLGDVAVLAEGHPIELGGTRQRSVLALLILQRDHPVATERLADRLWPDDQPLTATKTIQVYVSRIRRALGPHADRLSSSATGYRLAVADDELDAARFERGLRRAREALEGGSAEAALAGLEESLAEWSGPALGDLAGEQFAHREAERLEELRLQAFEELFELRIAAGAGRQAIGELRRLLADQPGRERLWRLLMLALYADGRQGEALQAYQDARRYLAEELGLDPGQELRDVEGVILAQEAPQPRQTLVTGAADAGVESVTIPTQATREAERVARRTRRVVTTLRADIVQTPDDNLDPEILEALDARALEIVRRAVERHGGTIDRADHDGVTAVFGLTVAREDDALRAVRAALELKDDETVILRVGVSTGEVLARPGDGGESRLTGAPLQQATSLAGRAARGEVLVAPETERLVRAVATTEPVPLDDSASSATAARVLALANPETIAPRPTTRFVGRETELAALLLAFEQVVTTGRPGLATVVGAPGVGKSRLVAEAFARIDDRANILRSRCLPYGDGITYWPVRELVLGGTGIAPGEPRDVGLTKLTAVLSGMHQADIVRSGIAAVVGLADDPISGEEIDWAARRFFEALARERPLVLVVDDLQWAEPALADLLEHVLDLGRGSILLVTIARPEVDEVRPDWFGRPGLLVRLDALEDADAAHLLDQLAPALPDGRLRTRVLGMAEGNPLFVEQFVAYAYDEASTGRPGLGYHSRDDLSIPPTIEALLAARLDRLPDIERRLLERASVIGRTFWSGALGELLSNEEVRYLPRLLAQLARRDLIRTDRSDFADDEAYRFRHLLIRDAAYASLPKRERAELHELFAGWLGRRSQAKTGEYDLIVAYHLEQAYAYRTELGHDPANARRLADRAVELLSPAGQAALERGDPHAAVNLLRRAANLASPGRRRTESLIALRSALRMAGEREASDAVDAEVVGLLADQPDQGLEYLRWVNEAPFLEWSEAFKKANRSRL